MELEGLNYSRPNILDTTKLDKALRLAKRKSKDGDSEEAKSIYQDILKKFSKNKIALSELQLLTRDSTIAPQDPTMEQLLSIIKLFTQGQMQLVLSETSNLLVRFPSSSVLYNISGASKAGLMQFDAAIASFERALIINPDYAEAHSNKGNALNAKGEPEAAIDSHKQALKIKPNYSEAYNNMGNAQIAKDDPKAAIDCYTQALKINPDYAEAANNMGNVLKDEGNVEAALRSYKQAIKINPKYAEAYNNRGNALNAKGEREAAIESFEQAIKIKPLYAEAYYNMGLTLVDNGNPEAAIGSYKHAIKINPNHAEFRVQKLHQQMHMCDWTSLEQDRHFISKLGASTEIITPYVMQSIEDAPKRHQVRSELFTKKFYGNKTPLPFAGRPLQKSKRLRIGYFSSDFHQHPVAYLMAKVLETHDRTCFEVYGYSFGHAKDDNMRKRLMKAFDVFTDVGDKNDKDVALLAREDAIDIAIDLNGHTKNSRLGVFAYRAAPVQINYLGYSGTIGADFIDYIIADSMLIPNGCEQYYNECILRLPHTFMPTDNTRSISKRRVTRSEVGLPETGFVFCCFNNNFKISPCEFDIWMQVLIKVQGSVLWLRSSNVWSEDNLRTEAEVRGVDPSRLVFAGWAPMDEHLARQKLADLFLDTFAYNAHTTASEALWAGLPVVTKAGRGFPARAAASLLTAANLPELITETDQEYEALILRLARSPEYLEKICQTLTDTRLSVPLFDTELFTKHLETGYQEVHQRHINGKLPKDIFVHK